MRPNRLWILAATAALPVIAFAAMVLIGADRDRQASVEQSLRLAARTVVEAVDGLILANLGALETLGAAPALEAGDLEAFGRHAERVLDLQRDWLAVALLDAAGGPVLVLGEVGPAGLPRVTDLPADGRRAVARGVMNDPTEAAPPVIPLVMRVGADGAPRHLVAMLRSEVLTRMLRDQEIPDDWTAAVLDIDRVIAGRNHRPDDFVGTPATPSLTEQLGRAAERFFFSTNKDGRRVYTAFRRSETTGWTAAIGVPADIVEAPLRRSFLISLVGAAVAVGIALILGVVLVRDAALRDEAERRLEVERTAERRLSDIAAHFPGVIYRRLLEPSGRIAYPYVSEGILEIAGDSPLDAEVEGDAMAALIHPEDRPRWLKAASESAQTLGAFEFEGRILRADGGTRWLRSAARPRRRPEGEVAWDGVALDVTRAKETEAALRQALDEKVTLLNEVHHRVKNNLQIITSLIRMERRRMAAGEDRDRVDAVAQRIQVMARLHEQLYASGDLARIDFAEHLRATCRDVAELQARGDIRVALEVEAVSLDLDTAIPLGLLANELLTNAFKHAFRDRGGTVRVGLRLAPGEPPGVELSVADDGTGDGAAPAAREGSIGVKLVQALTQQLGAEIRYGPGPGAVVTVAVPLRDRTTGLLARPVAAAPSAPGAEST